MQKDLTVGPGTEGRSLRAGGRHPDRAFDRLLIGEATPAERRRVVLHLPRCPRCQARAEEAWGERAGGSWSFGPVVDRVAARFSSQAARVAAERASAEEFVARLRRQPPARRRLMVTNTAVGQGRAVCERLLDENRSARQRDRTEALQWAELAVTAADRYSEAGAEDLRARALMDRADARRLNGDFEGAEDDFAASEELLRRSGADPLAWAELFTLRGSLAKDRRDLDAAVVLLKRAAARFSRYDDPFGLARSLILLGHVHALRGRALGGRPALGATDSPSPSDAQLRAIVLGTDHFLF